jgi:hypothetical protein
VRRAPTLCQSTAVHSPYLCGIIAPRIILPRDGAFTPFEIEMLLRHEVHHQHNRDLPIKYLINLCLAVQWWNPLLFLLAQRMSFYIEAACDESVLKGHDADFRLQYTTLLAMLARKNAAELKLHYALEAGFARHRGHAVLRRVQNLLDDAPRKRGGAVTAALAILCALSVFLYGFTSPETPSADDDDNESPTQGTEPLTEEHPSPTDTAGSMPTPDKESDPPSEESTTNREPQKEPAEKSVFKFKKIAGLNAYELVAANDRTITEAIIPSTHAGLTVAKIAAEAFADCTSLVRVVVPDTVKDIGNGAFLRCVSLREVTLSANLYSLGHSAFRECTALESIALPSGVMTLQADTFYRCTSLRNVTLSNGLQQIQSHAFYENPSLTQLTLPSSLWMMGAEAFQSCPSLSLMRYDGTVAQWGRMLRQTTTRDDTVVTWCTQVAFSEVQCTDGTVPA